MLNLRNKRNLNLEFLIWSKKMFDRWMTDGCTVHSFCKHDKNDYHFKAISKRFKFLNKWFKKENGWPFKHGIIQVPDSWWKNDGWALDPLIFPLLQMMNKIDGVTTIASCQGNESWSPSVLFAAPVESVLFVEELIVDEEYRSGNYWEDPVISLIPGRIDVEGLPSWKLCLYDPLCLMEFNDVVANISIEQQLAIPGTPKSHVVLSENKEKKEKPYILLVEGATKRYLERESKCPKPTVDEIVEILNMEEES